MANLRRDASKERFWRDVLKRFAASGLSVRGCCKRARLMHKYSMGPKVIATETLQPHQRHTSTDVIRLTILTEP